MASTARGEEKALAPPAHPPTRSIAQQLSSRGIAILENPSTKAGGPKGPSEALPPCPRTTVAPQDYGQRTTGSLSGPAPPATLPPFARAPTLICWPTQYDKEESTTAEAGRPKAGRPSLEWFSDRRHASAPRPATRKPPSSAEKEFSTPLPDSFFVTWSTSLECKRLGTVTRASKCPAMLLEKIKTTIRVKPRCT